MGVEFSIHMQWTVAVSYFVRYFQGLIHISRLHWCGAPVKWALTLACSFMSGFLDSVSHAYWEPHTPDACPEVQHLSCHFWLGSLPCPHSDHRDWQNNISRVSESLWLFHLSMWISLQGFNGLYILLSGDPLPCPSAIKLESSKTMNPLGLSLGNFLCCCVPKYILCGKKKIPSSINLG